MLSCCCYYEKNRWRSHACVENYMHAQIWTLFRVASQQSGHKGDCGHHHNHNQSPCYRMETFISFNHSLSPFPRAYKAKLTKFLPTRWCGLNFQGEGPKP